MSVTVMRLRSGSLLLCMWFLAAAVTAAETWREPTTGMEFVQLPKACFSMGSPDTAFAADDPGLNQRVRGTEVPQHEVCLDSVWIARTEVTIASWAQVMKPPGDASDLQLPASGMTRADAERFAQRLTEQTPGARFRLPTEAEWEYACRGGRMTDFSRVPDGDQLIPVAWFSSAYDMHPGRRLQQLQPVGTKQPNGYGLHDMLGNVWEWVADDYVADAYRQHALFSPRVSAANGLAAIRGGGLRTDRRFMRCETRGWLPADESMQTVGFRLVREEVKR